MILSLNATHVETLTKVLEERRDTYQRAVEYALSHKDGYSNPEAVIDGCREQHAAIATLLLTVREQTTEVYTVVRTIAYHGTQAALREQLGRSMGDGVREGYRGQANIEIETISDSRPKAEDGQ